MSYMLPVQFVKIGPCVCISASRIVSMMSVDFFQARLALTKERKGGQLINGCGKYKQKTAIFLDNGTVVSSPYSIDRIIRNLAIANETGRLVSRTDRCKPKTIKIMEVNDSSEKEQNDIIQKMLDEEMDINEENVEEETDLEENTEEETEDVEVQ